MAQLAERGVVLLHQHIVYTKRLTVACRTPLLGILGHLMAVLLALVLARHAHDDGMALRHHIFHMVGQRQRVVVVLVTVGSGCPGAQRGAVFVKPHVVSVNLSQLPRQRSHQLGLGLGVSTVGDTYVQLRRIHTEAKQSVVIGQRHRHH